MGDSLSAESIGTVAIIDDDDDVREVLEGLLEAAGHSVKSYRSGKELLADPAVAEMACLVIDHRMPQMTGLDLLAELNRRAITVPSVLITGANDRAIAREAQRLGAMHVLEKPITYQTLLRLIALSTG